METTICSHCQKSILTINILPHEAYCSRNVILCPKCNEAVNKKDLTTHENEAHILKYCTFCKELFEAFDLHKHIDICTKRLVKCKYCELNIEFNKMKDHIKECEVNQQKCGYCDIYIGNAQFDEHVINCEKIFFGDEKTDINNYNSINVDEQEFKNDELKNIDDKRINKKISKKSKDETERLPAQNKNPDKTNKNTKHKR